MDPDNILEIEDDLLGRVDPEPSKKKKDGKKKKKETEKNVEDDEQEEMDTTDQAKMDWNVEIDKKEAAEEKEENKKETKKTDKAKELREKTKKMTEKNVEMLGNIANMRQKEAWQIGKEQYQGKEQARKRLTSLKNFLDKEVKNYCHTKSYINYMCYMDIGVVCGRI